jgi:FkbM family methyltransferase
MKNVIIEHNDGKFLLFPQDTVSKILISGLISGKSNEPHFKEIVKLIHEFDVVMDGGGNLGYNSVLMGKRLGTKGKLLTFEPQRIIFQQLNANLILNNIYNAYTYNLALSNFSGQELQMEPINYEVDDLNIGGYSIGSGGEIVKTIKIDDLNLSRLDFIKLDIQGYEIFALEGGIETIKKYKPNIFVEIEDFQLRKFGKTPEDLILLIKSLGYHIYRMNFDYPLLHANYDHICTINNINEVENLNLPLIKIN